MKALIKVGYACNDHCTFCHTYDVRHIDDTADRVAQKIRRAAALGHSMVVFSGGEPTIRPEIVSWAKFANQLGLAVGLVTNGRMLSYAPFLERMLARRLEYVYLSLHGGDERVHDASVRSHAFAETARVTEAVVGVLLPFLPIALLALALWWLARRRGAANAPAP